MENRQDSLVAGKSRGTTYDNPEKPLIYKSLRDCPDHYKQAESRYRAGLKQAEKPGMRLRTGE